ncbi:MAG TPA: diguanylate cyclase, partial [bacterium]|nr:diguanylate cyclase [bacterium]
FLVFCFAVILVLGSGININRQIVAVKIFNEKLREKETVIFQFLSGLSIGIFVVKADGKTYFANHVALHLLGRDLKPREDFYEFRQQEPGSKTPLVLALQGIASTRDDMEVRGPDGKMIPVEVSGIPIRGSEGQLTYALTTFTDISERVKHQAELKNLSILDDLTGLFNRRGFMTLGEQQLKVADRTQSHLLLLFIDLDGFKQVNDREGHQSGDEMLREFARIIREHFRKADIMGRLGGDEFAILTEDGSPKDDAMIQRLREKVEAHNAVNPSRCRLDFSVGLAIYDPKAPCGLGQLISQADEQMYVEKEKKKKNPPSQAESKIERM